MKEGLHFSRVSTSHGILRNQGKQSNTFLFIFNGPSENLWLDFNIDANIMEIIVVMMSGNNFYDNPCFTIISFSYCNSFFNFFLELAFFYHSFHIPYQLFKMRKTQLIHNKKS